MRIRIIYKEENLSEVTRQPNEKISVALKDCGENSEGRQGHIVIKTYTTSPFKRIERYNNNYQKVIMEEVEKILSTYKDIMSIEISIP